MADAAAADDDDDDDIIDLSDQSVVMREPETKK